MSTNPIEAAAKETAKYVAEAYDEGRSPLIEKMIAAILRKHFPPAGEKELPDAEGWWWEWLAQCKWAMVEVHLFQRGPVRFHSEVPQDCYPGRWIRAVPPGVPLPPDNG